MKHIWSAAFALFITTGAAHAAKSVTYGLVVSLAANSITTCQTVAGSLADDLAAAQKATPEADIVFFGDGGAPVTDIKQAHAIAVRELGETGNPVVIAYFTNSPTECGALRLGIIKSQGVEPAR